MSLNSVLTQTPVNQNFLHTNKFSFFFPGLPWTNFFVQSVSIPGVSTSAVYVPTQQNPTFRHGDTLVYDTLSITVLIDEDMKVWEENYNWLRALTSPKKFSEYIKNRPSAFPNLTKPYTDAVLILDTNSNNYNFKFTFKDCHPIALTGIGLSQASSPDTTPSATITYQYDYYELERVNSLLT